MEGTNIGTSVSEKVWSAAETAGAERRKKIDIAINRVLGLPEAAGKLAEIGTEAVKVKAEEIKNKALDLKERTEQKISETKEKLADRYESAKDNLFSRIEAFKEKLDKKAKQLADRAVKAGLDIGLTIEDRIVKVLELPAELKEARAGKFETKATEAEKTREEVLAEQFAEKNGLSEVQKEAFEAFLAEQKEKKGMLEEEHKEVRAEMDKNIEAAKTRSLELKSEAAKIRKAVEKKRVFSGFLKNIKFTNI